jgi:hypothetical protein
MNTNSNLTYGDLPPNNFSNIIPQGPAVFDGWGEYQLRLLFSFWNIQTKWQFGLSCLAVIIGCIGLHGIIFLRRYIKFLIMQRTSTHMMVEKPEDRTQLVLKKTIKEGNIVGLKICYFFSTILFYFFILMLTLVTTTFNPWLFTSLIIGYSLGEMIVMTPSINLKIESKYI